VVGETLENQDDAGDDTDTDELWSGWNGETDALLQAGISVAEITMCLWLRAGVTVKSEEDLRTLLRQMATYIGTKHAA
jgi:hypothetical protein